VLIDPGLTVDPGPARSNATGSDDGNQHSTTPPLVAVLQPAPWLRLVRCPTGNPIHPLWANALQHDRAAHGRTAAVREVRMSSTNSLSGRSLNQLVAAVFGAVYVLVGIIGFFVASNGFAATSGGKILGIFEVNPLHNIAHILIGAVLLGAARAGAKAARGVNITIGAAYLLLGVLGLFILNSAANILALNSADNGLHFASALLLLVVGVAGRSATTGAAHSEGQVS
jgi:hypothetical protein